MKTDLKSMTLQECREYIKSIGEKPFRADQLYLWMHVRHASGFDAMTNLSKALRAHLAETCTLSVLKQAARQCSSDGETEKYLFELEDGARVESVFMRYRHGNSVCVSSQAGCRMGCTFCASTLDGLERSLTAAEMLDQIYRIEETVGERISHVVVMGMGEPLDNYENLLRFIRLLTDEHGLHISQRNVTVSTCGIVPRIYRLADERLQITLAVSLHAATQEKRERLMPIAKAFPLDALMEACRYYEKTTGRRVTFEYSLIKNVNDQPEDAKALSGLLRDLHGHVNLIPVNPVEETKTRPPADDAVRSFKNKLENYRINVTIRREMGRDIDGACGQLRKRGEHRKDIEPCRFVH